MNIESRGGSLPQRSSDELRAQLNLKNPLGQNFSPQVWSLLRRILADLVAAVLW